MEPTESRPRPNVLVYAVVLPIFGFSMYTLVRSLSSYESNAYERKTVEPAKIRIDGERQYLWALGPTDPDDPQSEWFDMTGAPLPLDGAQYGIGRDEIASIDEPVFVDPDDPRLMEMWAPDEDDDLDDLVVIGYEHAGDARAYPLRLLDHHELVNDTVGGKPVTVGW